MKKIYVGCAIIGAPEGYLAEIIKLKELIRNELGCEVMEFIPQGTGTVQDVYMNDIHFAVETCDAVVAEVSYPSLGLGWEMATAVEKLKKPVLLCAKGEVKVSRLVQGAAGPENPHCTFMRYEKMEDILPRVR